MAKATNPAATGQTGDISYPAIQSELMKLHCIAAGVRALAVEAGHGEIATLAALLANSTMGLHDQVDAAICGGAA